MQFDLSRIQKNPAVVTLDKLNWINRQHLSKLITNSTCIPPNFVSQLEKSVAGTAASKNMPFDPRIKVSQKYLESAIELFKVLSMYIVVRAPIFTT